VSLLLPELGAKRLELLREMVPGLSRVAVLWNAANPFRALDLKVTQAGARALGVTLQSLAVRGPDDFDRAFEAVSREGAHALITLEDPLTFLHRTRIVGLAAKHRLPALSMGTPPGPSNTAAPPGPAGPARPPASPARSEGHALLRGGRITPRQLAAIWRVARAKHLEPGAVEAMSLRVFNRKPAALTATEGTAFLKALTNLTRSVA
jgi:hypothetical protein